MRVDMVAANNHKTDAFSHSSLVRNHVSLAGS